MLAKTLEARLDNAWSDSLSLGKMGIWQKFGGWSSLFGEMLVKFARSGYAARLPAVGVPLPLMP